MLFVKCPPKYTNTLTSRENYTLFFLLFQFLPATSNPIQNIDYLFVDLFLEIIQNETNTQI